MADSSPRVDRVLIQKEWSCSSVEKGGDESALKACQAEADKYIHTTLRSRYQQLVCDLVSRQFPSYVRSVLVCTGAKKTFKVIQVADL